MSRGPIGFVGLGTMGGAMAARLIERGCEVWGYDPNPAAAERATQNGVRVVQLEQLAELDVVATSLPNDQVVESVALGENGLIARMKPNSLLVELSTILPHTIRAIAEKAAARGVGVVDCPVSGGPAEARGGTLVLMVGASPEDFERIKPVLEHLGEPKHVGGVGDGKTVKIVNNVMAMGNVLVAAEAFMLGRKAGVDGERLFGVLSNAGGRSHHFLKRFPFALKRDFSPRFALHLAEKDLRLALELGKRLQYPMMMTSLAQQLYAMAMGQGLQSEDVVAVIKLYEQWAGAKAAETTADP